MAAITLPELGCPSIRFSVWLADVGDLVYEGDQLLEVLAGPATFDVTSPATGRLAEKLAHPDDRLQPGQLLGRVEVETGIQ
jgi:pyruvate/2-oxoglutarate dehydrogenase complex dihydrolipoamide acyltransferase (E2) component